MVLNYIFGALAGLSLILLLWQWVVARRFPLHRRSADLWSGAGNTPDVTLLKPLKDADEHTEMCLRSWLTQGYAGSVQMLFGVATADDPAGAVVRKLLAEFPKVDAQLVVCPEQPGANPKVSTLIQLERLARHELICVSDADVRVPTDFLLEAVRPLTPSLSPSDGEKAAEGQVRGIVALVNCFYRLANPTTLAMRCKAVAINADFWSQVLQSCSLKPMDFALGAAMLTRRTELTGIGGFAAIKDCLADDYQLGNRIVRGASGTGVSPVRTETETHGRDARATMKRIEICPVVVECWEAPMGWAAVWKHQLRWARTVRVCQPAPYFFSVLSNPTFWPALWAVVTLSRPALIFLGVALAVRLAVTADLQRRLACGDQFVNRKPKMANQMRSPCVGSYESGFWLAPVKDLIQVAVWALAFVGNTIVWRGRRMRVHRDGTLIPA